MSKLEDAVYSLINELIMATGFPDSPFTVVLTIEPKPIFDTNGDEATAYGLTKLVINEEIYIADGK